VLTLLARGRSNKQIAGELGIAPRTAGHDVEHVYAKLGVSTRAAAALFAVEHGGDRAIGSRSARSSPALLAPAAQLSPA